MIYCSSVRRVSVSSCNSYTCLDYTRSSHICQAFSTGGQAEQEIEEREQAFSLPPPPRPPARPEATRPSRGHPPVPRPPARPQATGKGWPLYTIKRTRSRIYSKKGAAVARSESVWPYEDRPPIVDAILLADGFAQIERYLKPLVLSDEMSLLTRGISVEPPAASGRIIQDVRSNTMENSLPALSLLILFVGIDVSKA